MAKMAVLGAGVMGTSIAYRFSLSGWEVLVVEPNPSQRERSKESVISLAADGIRQSKVTEPQGVRSVNNVEYLETLSQLPQAIDLIVECVPEDTDLKFKVLKEAEALDPKVLTTSSASISVNLLAKYLDHPERFLGLHFLDPNLESKVVEVVRGGLTSETTLKAVLSYITSIGIESSTILDSPGFASSRLEIALALEAMRMVEESVSTPQDIDRLITHAFGHVVGPLMQSDMLGLDVRLETAIRLQESLGERFRPPQLLIDMVQQGRLGKKCGEGFYRWS
ncbi:3-hydroxybutyryl-CoA dehydrogenase [Ferrithrix thermotolerans DSM 19514]|uniref:3-hydroxybutyryl-CoA dehydrogenase n=1 Tax=Ferrithrix thermotolerans DSM 19514 TaxID=1121881 RepID=A0A1M4XCE1_9ACTN|nr:3-hydroxyacyl-CoA dehydrogenase NAD-binding domain-containing protein [Ferrithrix thermotolerans]SHE91204.1 3-hydroxybutyryl-CoA dehydrogenase [Ferrithrix thermotolerans DSM 19514]